MNGEPFGEEGYSLLADDEGLEAADAAVEFVREQRRLRGEPTMSIKEAVWRATSYLAARSPAAFAATYRATPDGTRNLWTVHCSDPAVSELGVEVTADGEVRDLPADGIPKGVE